MKTPTIEAFKAWAKEHQSLALAVCKAQAFAKVERERVDAYIRPIFDRYAFKDERGEPIKKPDDLYHCKDEVLCAAYYAECDSTHREHGFRGPEGYCPALVAKDMQLKTEWALLDTGATLFGFGDITLYGENHAKMLNLLLGACLVKEKKAA